VLNPEIAPRAIIIAGPNGAGKTTFATEYLPNEGDCLRYANANLIARGLSPFDPDLAAVVAGRLLLELIDDYAAAGDDFAFETTLSGRTYARRIQGWRSSGYYVRLIFLWLPSVEIAVRRVRQRVAQGGHNVPENVIRRRFASGLAIYKPLVNEWRMYDNSGVVPRLMDSKNNP
jgi:predicted ABC-type ATPase